MKTLKYLGGSQRVVTADDLKNAFNIEVDYPVVANPGHRTCVVDDAVCDKLVEMDSSEWEDISEVTSTLPVVEGLDVAPKADGGHPIPTEDPAITEADAKAAPKPKSRPAAKKTTKR